MTHASALTPSRDDVVLSRADDGSDAYVLSKPGGTPQIVCATYELAAAEADRFARARRLDVWRTDDSRTFTRILVPSAESRVNPDRPDTPSASVNDSTSKMAAILRRVQGEFLEMPGLCLTEAQARRLWTMDAPTCSAVLETLIAAGFLCRTRDGAFMRIEQARSVTLKLASSAPGRSAA